VAERGARARENFALRESERWQPPPFRPPRSAWDRLVAAARRVLDLQAASIWRDLKIELADAHGDVLDVGAGAQPYRPLLPRGARYRAIDVAIAGEAFGYELPDTEYFEGDRWPVDDASVDLVLATETLEHVPEPLAFLVEARRVLRPGGRIVLTVPFAARWHYIPHDYWRYTPSSLSVLLKEAGFDSIVVRARGDELTVACYKLLALALPALFPSRGGLRASRIAAILALPMMVAVALVAHLSIRRGGLDCLGWTATASAATAV
jgi:SAM-dependent methyltransferase